MNSTDYNFQPKKSSFRLRKSPLIRKGTLTERDFKPTADESHSLDRILSIRLKTTFELSNFSENNKSRLKTKSSEAFSHFFQISPKIHREMPAKGPSDLFEIGGEYFSGTTSSKLFKKLKRERDNSEVTDLKQKFQMNEEKELQISQRKKSNASNEKQKGESRAAAPRTPKNEFCPKENKGIRLQLMEYCFSPFQSLSGQKGQGKRSKRSKVATNKGKSPGSFVHEFLNGDYVPKGLDVFDSSDEMVSLQKVISEELKAQKKKRPDGSREAGASQETLEEHKRALIKQGAFRFVSKGKQSRISMNLNEQFKEMKSKVSLKKAEGSPKSSEMTSPTKDDSFEICSRMPKLDLYLVVMAYRNKNKRISAVLVKKHRFYETIHLCIARMQQMQVTMNDVKEELDSR